MFAEPESLDSVASGWMYQNMQMATAAGKKLAVYEVNVGPFGGNASQSQINSTIPSVAAGLDVANHMLLMMRDDNIKTQQVWSLHEYYNEFNGGPETVPIFGATIDMGGETNLKRPLYYAEQLVNTAILPNMLGTTVTGANPTWNQPLSSNGNIGPISNAHDLQTFAFSDGGLNRSVVVINLSRTSALPVTFSDVNAPTGTVTVSQLTSANITDGNEVSAVVAPTSKVLTNFQPATPYSLPPFSMTVFTYQQ